MLVPPSYTKVSFFKQLNTSERGSVIFKGKKAGLINRKNKFLIPFKYENIYPLNYGYLALKKKGKLSLYHLKKGFISKFRYKRILNTLFFDPEKKDTLFRVVKKNKVGIINQAGKTIIKPQYQSIIYFITMFSREKQKTMGLFVVKQNGKYGVCNYNNKMLIPAKYESLLYLGKRVKTFKARVGKYVGVIDINNKKILDFKFQNLEYSGFSYFVEKQGKVAKFSRKGKQISPFKTGTTEEEEIFIYAGATIRAVVRRKNNKFALVDRETQKNITPFKYTSLKNLSKYNTRLFKVTLANGQWGYLAHDGTEYFDD